jgi:hypothetical protein
MAPSAWLQPRGLQSAHSIRGLCWHYPRYRWRLIPTFVVFLSFSVARLVDPKAAADIKSDRQDLCWEVAFQFVRRQLPRAAVVSVDEAHGWKYRDGRDLTGFIDGTANPDDEDSRSKAALVRKQTPCICTPYGILRLIICVDPSFRGQRTRRRILRFRTTLDSQSRRCP